MKGFRLDWPKRLESLKIRAADESKQYKFMKGGFAGGFDYNFTTESEYEEMKQVNMELKQENQALKETINDLIKINTQLTDSMEHVNNTILEGGGGKNQENQQLQEMVQELQAQLEERNMVDGQQQSQSIIEALQKLIDSFNQMQLLYESQLQSIYDEMQGEKKAWEEKLREIESNYVQSIKHNEEFTTMLKKKEQILESAEKKIHTAQHSPDPVNLMGSLNLAKSRRVIKKSSDMDTISERKFGNSEFNQNYYENQVIDLRNRQRQLMQDIRDRDHTISIYSQLMGKLRKKLTQKY